MAEAEAEIHKPRAISALALIDMANREHANNVLIVVKWGDFRPSFWLERIGIDVQDKINKLLYKRSSLRVK